MTKSHRHDRDLTDLEALVLAYVYRRQPCTPYQVRLACGMSTTTQFSSSAGSIYPLMKRLAERGYMKARKNTSDGRGSRVYCVSAKGLRKVQAWITSITDPAEIGIYDPIRARLLNLSLLANEEQIRWLETTISLLERQKDLIRSYETQEFVGDQRLYAISREGMWAENATRLRWLRKAHAVVIK